MATAPTLDIDRILSAHQHIDPVFLNSPLVGQPTLDQLLGCTLLAKVETLNPIRSFKGRGSEFFAATRLSPGEALVCASAGNFGQGLARAARRRGHDCIVFAAATANPLKIEAMRRFGADVRQTGADFDAAKDAARDFAAKAGLRFVEDGLEPAIAEGVGTLGLELAAAAPDLESAIVPLGNGSLLAGVGAALRHAAPGVEIVGVVAEQAPSMQLSLREGRVIETKSAETIADGIAVRVPIPETLDQLQGRYDSIVAVSEESLRQAMRLILEHFGMVVEPAGAVGLAAILADPQRFKGRKTAMLLCGGNISAGLRDELFASLAAA